MAYTFPMHEWQDKAFGPKSEGWENAGNEEGLPQVERKEQHGYHRAFISRGGGKFDWFFVSRDPKTGEWKRAHEESYASVGEVRVVDDGTHKRLAGRVFVLRENGATDAEAIYLPWIED